ncbi:hypothetical protein Q1695_002177 [Nippostrongylus brasiliensis]|nr:hypothetical protein Q1695_002177 [Nippostrongylus brasiliensis]
MSKQPSDEPKTIAEAKAEITEVLTKIKEHYDAILQMRLQDRNKWKEFNKIVEELEVVKARALKEEKRRQRDKERAAEKALFEQKNFASTPKVRPVEQKEPPKEAGKAPAFDAAPNPANPIKSELAPASARDSSIRSKKHSGTPSTGQTTERDSTIISGRPARTTSTGQTTERDSTISGEGPKARTRKSSGNAQAAVRESSAAPDSTGQTAARDESCNSSTLKGSDPRPAVKQKSRAAQLAQRDSSVVVLTGQTAQAMPLGDLEKTQDMGQSDLKFDEKAGRDQRSATSKARPADDEMTPEKERTPETRTPRASQFRDGFYKAKVVNVPIVVYESEKNNDNEKPDGLKKPRKKPSDPLLISYDMADEKYRYH